MPGKGAAALLGLPPSELVDLAVPVDTLWGRSAAPLGERVAGSASPVQALGLLQHAVLARRAADPDPLVAEAVRHLVAGLTGTTPRAFLADTADQCGCGHDHAASCRPLLRTSRRAG